MGDVIQLSGRPRDLGARAGAARTRGRGGPPVFAFDLASPYTYLAAERVDRMFTRVRWLPVLDDAAAVAGPGTEPAAGPADDRAAGMRAAAAARASALRLPLVWPEPLPAAFPAAMRIAALAAAEGRGAAFVLAAGRLAFCGGFDLDDPEILAEAAGAAGLPLGASLQAARDRTLDEQMRTTALMLRAQGAVRLPVLRVGGSLFFGEERLAEALAATRGRHTDPGPVAPSAG